MKFPVPEWTREMMAEKFHWLVATVLDSAVIDELLDMVWSLDEIGTIKELTDRLR